MSDSDQNIFGMILSHRFSFAYTNFTVLCCDAHLVSVIRSCTFQAKLNNAFFIAGLIVTLKATLFAICDETNNVSFFLSFLNTNDLRNQFHCFPMHVESVQSYLRTLVLHSISV